MTIKQRGGVFGRNPSFNDVSVETISIAGTALSSTVDELNILDGVTSDATELNYLDGASTSVVTASKAVLANASANIAFASGNGIDFSATGDGSGTTSNELFDDYEEGEWTPSVGRQTTFGSYTPGAFDGGKYTKIGNVVYFSCRVGGTNTTASGGNWVIRGLPFANANDFTWGRTTYQIIGSDGTPGGANSGKIFVYVNPNTSDLSVGTLVSGSTYYASGFYFVN